MIFSFVIYRIKGKKILIKLFPINNSEKTSLKIINPEKGFSKRMRNL
jgi:hypothetical protein